MSREPLHCHNATHIRIYTIHLVPMVVHRLVASEDWGPREGFSVGDKLNLVASHSSSSEISLDREQHLRIDRGRLMQSCCPADQIVCAYDFGYSVYVGPSKPMPLDTNLHPRSRSGYGLSYLLLPVGLSRTCNCTLCDAFSRAFDISSTSHFV